MDAINNRLIEHWNDVHKSKPELELFVIALQGSQNYGLADEDSDIDSKALVIPSMRELILDNRPRSYVHVMPNDEHCDVKDVREYMKIVLKSNINFIEIFFTKWIQVNEKYQQYWNELHNARERIARINPYLAVKSMAGMAHSKCALLTHRYPSKVDLIDKYGYDSKQLCHLIRIDYFIDKYINQFPYEDCIRLDDIHKNYLMDIKRYRIIYTPEEAMAIAKEHLDNIHKMEDMFCLYHENEFNKDTYNFLQNIIYELVRESIKL